MADHAQEPLMHANHDADNESTLYAERDHDSSPLEHKARHPGLFVWLLTFSAGISGLLFGYDTGVISATLISVGTSLSSHPLSTADKSIITASTSLFALIISPVSGLLADSLGRKKVILIADLLFILGALIQALASTVWGMVIGRSIIGLAVGAASFVTPLYIAELSPSKYRGALVTMSVLFITFGQVLAYLIGWGFSEKGGPSGWRWMVGLGAVPAAFQCLVMLIMPESPRWLIKVGLVEQARHVLLNVYRSGQVSQAVARDIEQEVREEEELKRGRLRGQPIKRPTSRLSDSWSELFRVSGNRRALTIACLLQGLQQLCGFNSLMYFSATLFSLLGFSSPTLTSLSVAVTNLLFTLASLLLIDFLGRRRILLLSIPVMILALFACALSFYFVILPTDTNSVNPASSPDAMSVVPMSTRYAALFIVGSIIVYVASYAIGLGNVPWQQSELFPLNVRSLGSSLSTATNWGSNFLVGVSFLTMLEVLSPTWTFFVYAVICLLGWVAIWFVYPETKGLSLEETGELLRDGWGVRKSPARRSVGV